MIGAIAGDIIGSIYESRPIKTTAFPLFHKHCHPTDDTILTVALADSILNGVDYVRCLKDYFVRYPHAGYGASFARWAMSMSTRPYNSWGNGSAMRVSPVGFAYSSLDEVLAQAQRSAEVTHNHPEGVKGAQATAAAIFLARSGQTKAAIKEYIEKAFAYDLSPRLDDLRPEYQFDVSCQGTVPPAIIAFLESTDFEDAVRKAISLGGDSDTLACITGGMAHAFYGGVPVSIKATVYSLLDAHLARVTREFTERFNCC
jgi:ADP-ribosylglycohydrolase